MGPFAALALATPIWGFALLPPTPLATYAPAQVAQQQTPPDDEPFVLQSDAEAEAIAHTRMQMDVIRGVEVATNVAMAVAFALATIAFTDRWGFYDSQDQTPCARGTTLLGYCANDVPIANLAAAGTSAALSVTNFLFWWTTDIPLAERIDAEWHAFGVIRILARVMNVIGAIAGILIWDAVEWGWADEQADFHTLQALAIGHMAWGAATLAVETAATVVAF
jgi:hypothetical protein